MDGTTIILDKGEAEESSKVLEATMLSYREGQKGGQGATGMTFPVMWSDCWERMGWEKTMDDEKQFKQKFLVHRPHRALPRLYISTWGPKKDGGEGSISNQSQEFSPCTCHSDSR